MFRRVLLPPRSCRIDHRDLCHPTPLRSPFTREGWVFELKHDGFRALARRGKTAVQMLSRQGRSMTEQFPEVVAALRHLPTDTALDGELVVPTPEGRADFDELRRRNLLQRPHLIAEAAARSPAVLIVFDVLEIDGQDVRDLPLLERRRVLRRHVEPTPGLQVIDHVDTHGEALFRAIVEHDQEGIVAKRIDAPYRADRQSTWLKIKNRDYSRRGAVEWQG